MSVRKKIILILAGVVVVFSALQYAIEQLVIMPSFAELQHIESDKNIRLQPRNEKYSPTIIEGERINGIYRAEIKYEKL